MINRVLLKLDDAFTVRILKEMIRIPSVVGEEGELAGYICNSLQTIGFECEMQEVETGRPNVYARLGDRTTGRRLCFYGHTDTVPVVEGWETEPFVPVEKDGRIYGVGACDMKAGIACIINVLRAFASSGFPFKGELSFAGVIDEEAFSSGAQAMLKSEYRDVDAIVLAEPYSGDDSKPIPLGITGKILYSVRVRGKAAHGFSPELGINAVEEAAKILTNLDRLNLKNHPKFGTGNYCTLKIEGGYRAYSVVIPEDCRFEVNRLLVPGETPDSAVSDMEGLVRSLNLKADVEVKTKPPRYEAYLMEKESPIIQIFDGVYREVMGVAPVYSYEHGITDANIFAGEGGIPCLHLGPKSGAAHQKNEYVPLDWLPWISRMYALIAAQFLQSDR
jgi:succinyl-diaminopimelate desuccinylase